jgi:hypothetical protein
VTRRRPDERRRPAERPVRAHIRPGRRLLRRRHRPLSTVDVAASRHGVVRHRMPLAEMTAAFRARSISMRRVLWRSRRTAGSSAPRGSSCR